MDKNFDYRSFSNGQSVCLPTAWFESRITLEQIRLNFALAKETIRIACGFFTLKGWGLIRRYTKGKRVYLLVGIDEPGEERARIALIQEIMRHLATGRDSERRQSAIDLIQRIEADELWVVDARAHRHHGKVYIVDRHTAINSSANTTQHGFLEQIESGDLLGPLLVEKFVAEYGTKIALTPEIIKAFHDFVETQVAEFISKFDEYFLQAKDITQPLLEALRNWLTLVRPWDVYLKTILALEQIKAIDKTYSKKPLSYQQDMMAVALSQIRAWGGSMLVASTGLGKTIIGTCIAKQLQAEDLIDGVIVLCPVAVRKIWRQEMGDANLPADCLTLNILDLEDETKYEDLQVWNSIVERVGKGRRYLLILDESHKLRKRYPEEFGNRLDQIEQRRERLAFTRIVELANQVGERERVKVLLLSGSPYATDIDNINTQLALLPHNNPNSLNGSGIWQSDNAEQFLNLDVTHQLTTPYVARYYGKIDTLGHYLEFGSQKRYFPDVTLYNIISSLVLEDDLLPLFEQNYFDLNIGYYRKNIETLVKIAWSSSPLALRDILERVVDTPNGLKAFDFVSKRTSNFVVEQSLRQASINPIIEKLKSLAKNFADQKLKNLLEILKFHCPKEKVVIFCERYSTAFYLEQALSKLLPSLKVYSSAYRKPLEKKGKRLVQYSLKSLKQIEKAIAAFAPISNQAVGRHQETYDVFIATDAFGVGVNMQDASVVVNYDISWTPIEPIQRAGRVLRPWTSPRTVTLYTFIPTLKNQSAFEELPKIQRRWSNLLDRHQESRKFTDFPVLTKQSIQTINMPDFAPDTEIEKGSLSLKQTEDEDVVSRFYHHARKLHAHRNYAQGLKNDLVSALVYGGSRVSLFLLLNYQEKSHAILYDPQTQTLRYPSLEALLDLIECSPETEVAAVEPEEIERLGDECIRLWCEQNHVDEGEVVRECTLYLNPKTVNDTLENLLTQ